MRTFDEEYNTQRPHLILKEYGRNIQNLAHQLMKIEDEQKRNDFAVVVIDMMRAINPNVNENPEYNQKLWDDLILATAFELEVDGPFPRPDKKNLFKKPQRLSYNKDKIKFKHYGRNIELLIEKAIATTTPEEKEAFIFHIARLMKTFYGVWNKEVMNDEIIYRQIKDLSKGQLEIPESLLNSEEDIEVLYKEKSNNTHSNNGKNHKKNKKNHKKHNQGSNHHKQRRRH